jgi:2-iminobutanoate/2-iminopropanoate deaminase
MAKDKRAVFPEGAPKTLGAYSPVLISGGFLFISGQVGRAPDGYLGSTIEEQARQTIENIGMILRAAGCDYDDVVKATVFITKSEFFQPFNQIYSEYFSEPRPARATVLSALVDPALLIEIEAIAKLPE